MAMAKGVGLVAGFGLVGMLFLCACVSPGGHGTPQEMRRSELIDNFISLCDSRLPESLPEGLASARHYRNGTTPEIVFETRLVEGAEHMTLTPAEESRIRNTFIEQVGTEFSVAQIREYGDHGIVFTCRAITHDGRELYRIPIPFDTMLAHFSHP